MLNKIVDLSLRYKLLVLVGFGLVVFLGVRAFLAVPVDAFPDVTPNQVNVYTESPGLAAEDVEKLLTSPIETAMAGLPGVEQIRSVSLFGLSYVGVYFKDDVDIYFARRLVGEKLQEAKERIPAGLRRAEPGAEQFGPRPGVLVHGRVGRPEALGHGPAHPARLERAAHAAHRAGGGRRHHLGRLREAVPGADPPAEAHQVRLTFKP
jgi:hypothetical protein